MCERKTQAALEGQIDGGDLGGGGRTSGKQQSLELASEEMQPPYIMLIED